MTAIKNLIEGKTKKSGNHRVERVGDITKYIYHYTAICTVNEKEKTFKLDNGGYRTVSTTRAINEYRRKFSMLGYNEI